MSDHVFRVGCLACDDCGKCISCNFCLCELTIPAAPELPAEVRDTKRPPPPDPLERIAVTLDRILAEVRGLRIDAVGMRADVDDLKTRVTALEAERT